MQHRRWWQSVILLSLAVASMCPCYAISHEQYNSMDKSVFVLIRDAHWEAAKPILLQMCNSPYATSNNFCTLAKCYVNQVPGEENLGKAAVYCKRAIAMDPECGQAFACLADVCYQLDQFDDALRYANVSIKCKTPDLYGYFVRAKLEAAQRHYKEAIADIDKWDAFINAKDKKTRPNYQLKGQIYEKMGKYDEAIGEYRNALPFEAEGPRKNIIRCLQKLNRMKDAIAEASILVKNNPRDGDGLSLRAELEMQMHDYRAAVADYTKAIELSPLANYYRGRSRAYDALGQKDLAKKDSERSGSIEF